MHEKTMTPRSCLRWKPAGKIFNTVGLRWVPTGKIFSSSTTKVDSEHQNGSNKDITNTYEYEQTLNGFKEFKSNKQAMTSDHNSSELAIQDHSNKPYSSKLVPNVVPPADKTATSQQELSVLTEPEVSTVSTKLSTASVTLYCQKKVNAAKDSRLSEEDKDIIDLGLGSTSGIRVFALRNFDLEVMEFETAQNTTTAKLPILKLENGNSWVSIPQTTQENDKNVTKMSVPVTAEEKINKKNDVKARSLLLMALPNEHQLTFNQYTDAKTMYAAIKTRFGGNEATKKTQKALLKQQYENFNASSLESLDSIFNMLQKLVSRLAILGVVITTEDLNSKFLRSLPPKWNTHVVVWMNKAEIETKSIDDLYNNLKIVEQEVKKSIGASTVSTITSNVNTASSSDLEQIRKDDLEEIDLKWQFSLLSMRAKRYFQTTGKKIFINANDTAGYDKTKNQESSNRTVKVEDTSSKAMLAIDGVGFDWSDMAEEQIQTNMALMAYLDSEVYTGKSCSKTCLKNYKTLKKQCDDLIVKLNDTEFKAATYKRGLAIVEDQLITFRKSEVLFSEEIAVLKREVGCKDYKLGVLNAEFEKVKQEKEGIDFKIINFYDASKSLDKLLESQITDNSKNGIGYHVVPPPHPLSLNAPTKLDLSYSGLDEFKKPEFHGYGSRDTVLKSTIECDKESDNSKKNTDDSLDIE
ncbi:hypothetical protein Tco_0331830 [Tanacetum coccineum]